MKLRTDRVGALVDQLAPSAELSRARPEGLSDEVWTWVERWTGEVKRLTGEQLETAGFGQCPCGLDPEIPFIGVTWWVNREFIHYMAEVALLRDLSAHRHA